MEPLRRSDEIELLRTIPLFSDLSDRHLRAIARAGQQRRVLRGWVITRQGDLGREVFLIVNGQARVERDGKLLARLRSPDCFGEMSLLDGKPRSASVIADSDVDLLVVPASEFHKLVLGVAGLSRRLLATLSERLRTADVQLATRN